MNVSSSQKRSASNWSTEVWDIEVELPPEVTTDPIAKQRAIVAIQAATQELQEFNPNAPTLDD